MNNNQNIPVINWKDVIRHEIIFLEIVLKIKLKEK